MSSIEQQVIDAICPDESLSKVESFIPKILAVEAQLDGRKTASVSSNMTLTRYKCHSCGNTDQTLFSDDTKHGQVTCVVCGVVAQDSKIHDGAWKRQYQGDINPSFHGPSPDPKFSSGHNLRTSMSLGSYETPGGTKVTKKELRDLKYAQNFVEMNLSNFGADVKRTREGYKDKMKTEAFQVLDDVGFSLQLHESVIQRAKALFAGYRDMLEQIQALKVVEAACIITAYRAMIEKGQNAHSYQDDGITNEENSTKRQKLDAEETYAALHPFLCKSCGQRFNAKRDLRLHTKHYCPKRTKADITAE